MMNSEIFSTLYSLLPVIGATGAIVGGSGLLIIILFFILRGFGLFDMSKALGLKNGVLAFIPIAADYSLGKVAACYRKNNGKKSAPLGVWLLVLRILKFVLNTAFAVLFVLTVLTIGSYAIDAVQQETEMTREMFALVWPTLIVFATALIVSVCHTVLLYVCYWRIFSLYDHVNATVYTLITVIFRVLGGLFVFILRKRPAKLSFDERLGLADKKADE